MNMNKKASGIVLIVIAIVMCLITFGNQAKYKAFVARAEQTPGQVIDIDKTTSSVRTSRGRRRRRTKYKASVKYTVEGVNYTTSFSSGASALSEGSTVTIYYDPVNPSKAYSDAQMNGSNNFAFVLVLVLGVYQFVKGKKEDNDYIDL